MCCVCNWQCDFFFFFFFNWWGTDVLKWKHNISRYLCIRTGHPLRAELCRRTGLCWRTWFLGERTLLEYAERYTSYLCKKDGYVHAVHNWQCGLVLGGCVCSTGLFRRKLFYCMWRFTCHFVCSQKASFRCS